MLLKDWKRLRNRKMRKKLTIIISLLILIGGIYISLQWYDSVARLSDDDLIWMGAYELGDTIVFSEKRSNCNDTAIINSKGVEHSFLPFSPDPLNWRQEYHGMGRVTLVFRHNRKISKSNSFFIKKYDDSFPCVVRWHILGLESYDSLTNKKKILKNKDKDEVLVSLVDTTINGIFFEDCLVGNLNNSKCIDYNYYDSLASLHATEFIWSKRYGLLQYRMEGDTYTRTDIENLKSKPTGHKEPVNWMHSQTFRDFLKFIRNHSLM